MRRLVFCESLVFHLAVILAGLFLIHHRGGVPWLLRQCEEQASGRSGPVNSQVLMFRTLPDSPNDIYLVGDSIVAGLPCELFNDPWVKNRGISGDTTAGVLARMDEVTQGRPRVIVLLLGVNDIQRGWALEDTLARYRQILERVRTECSKSRVFILSVLPACEYAYRQYITPIHPEAHLPGRAETQALNEELRTLADGNVTYVDLWPDMVQDGQLRPEYTGDGLHPNDRGYMALVHILKPLIE